MKEEWRRSPAERAGVYTLEEYKAAAAKIIGAKAAVLTQANEYDRGCVSPLLGLAVPERRW